MYLVLTRSVPGPAFVPGGAGAGTGPGRAERRAAADRLEYVPAALLEGIELAAAAADAAGRRVARADLLAPMLARLSVERAQGAMLDAVEGAVAVAPELAPRRAALRAAVAGFTALLTDAASDRVPGRAWQVHDALSGALADAARPLLDAAYELDPPI